MKIQKLSINDKKKITALLLLLFFGIILLILTTNFKKIIKSEIQLIQTHFVSFSSGLALFDDGTKKEYKDIKFKDLLPGSKQAFKVLIDGIQTNQNQSLKNLKIIINFKNLNQIYADREKAIKKSVNYKPNYVPCKITDGEKIFDCNVRLKGDLEDHWFSKYRMSLRVQIKNGSIYGLQNFSIHKPRARQFPYDQTFHKINAKIGGLSSYDQRFVNFKLNEKNWGVMNIEPLIDDNFIKNVGITNSGVFKISNQDNWRFNEKNKNSILKEGYFISDPTIFFTQRGKDKIIMKNKDSRKLHGHIFYYLSSKNSLIFDRKKMIDSFVLSLCWGSLHVLKNSNSLYTWNSSTKKLEPILTDQNNWNDTKYVVNNLRNLPYEYLTLFKNNPISKDEFLNSLVKIEKYLKYNDPLKIANNLKSENFPNDRKFLKSPINRNIIYIKNNTDEIISWINQISSLNNFQKQNSDLKIENYIKTIDNFIKVVHFTNGKIEIYNLISKPVFISKIKFKNKIIQINKKIKGSSQYSISSLKIETDFTGIQDEKIKIYNNLGNFKKITKNKFSLISSLD